MASPLKTGKQSVKLASPGARVSRIRRDPPPAVKEKFVDPDERDQWTVVIGVLTFTLSLFVILLAFSGYSGWSPRQYTIEVSASE